MKKIIVMIILIILVIAGLSAGGYFLLKSKTKITNPISTLASKSPWPMFHGNYNHSGYADVTGPQANQLKWKYLIGATEGNFPNSVVVAKDGTIFVAGNNKITALSTDGSLKWDKEYLNPQGPALSADGQTLYFASQSSLVAASPVDGAKKWEFKAEGNMSKK